MDNIQKYQILRAMLHRAVDETIDWAIEHETADLSAAQMTSTLEGIGYESVYPLTTETGVFKGKKPTGVIFQDGHRIAAASWKKVFEVIMKQCNSDSEKHWALMELRGKVMGRSRTLLDSKKGQMRSPIQIDRALYAETHYDTETLLRILTTRILDVVRYDYTGIKIAIKED